MSSDKTGDCKVQRLFAWAALCALFTLSGTRTAPSFGRDKPVSPPRPLYPIPRYEEDWSFLSDPSKQNDWWDTVKFIPLSKDRSAFLSLGGEIRETYERFQTLTLVFLRRIRMDTFYSVTCS